MKELPQYTKGKVRNVLFLWLILLVWLPVENLKKKFDRLMKITLVAIV